MSLKVDFPNNPKNSFEIKRDDNFMSVEGIKNMDTAKVVNYVRMYEHFRAMRFIEKGESPIYDSLRNTVPIATITLKDIDLAKSKTLDVFAFTESDSNVLGLMKEDNQLVLISRNKVFGLLQQKEFFEKN